MFLLCTASIMMDGGMTEILSTTIVRWTGSGYSFMAALIGTLGTFITGTNTNSNILFGSLQETAALSLSLSPALMCAVQSIAASVGGTIGPTNTALVAAVAGKKRKRKRNIFLYHTGHTGGDFAAGSGKRSFHLMCIYCSFAVV